MDSNPRHFFLDVGNAECNVEAKHEEDFVTIEFAGAVTPSVRKRLEKAMASGNVEITVKKMLG